MRDDAGNAMRDVGEQVALTGACSAADGENVTRAVAGELQDRRTGIRLFG